MSDSETKQSQTQQSGASEGKQSSESSSPPPQQTAESNGKQPEESPPPQQTAESNGKQPEQTPPSDQTAESNGNKSDSAQTTQQSTESNGKQSESVPPPSKTVESDGKQSESAPEGKSSESAPPPSKTMESDGKSSESAPPPSNSAESDGKSSESTPPPSKTVESEGNSSESAPPPSQTTESDGIQPADSAGTVEVQDESNGNNIVINDEEKVLMHLEFVQVAAIYLMMWFSAVYDYAKENSGPLKPGVQSVEATVKTVIGPVYDKLRDIPLELLVFLDRKVDAALSESDNGFPTVVKQAAERVLSAANKAAAEVQRSGSVVGAAKAAWDKDYEPAAEELAVSVWRWLNRLPLFPEVAHMVVVPTAAYWSEKYNDAVIYASDIGFPVAAYLPLVPIERITKVFEERGSGGGGGGGGDCGCYDQVVVTADGDEF